MASEKQSDHVTDTGSTLERAVHEINLVIPKVTREFLAKQANAKAKHLQSALSHTPVPEGPFTGEFIKLLPVNDPGVCRLQVQIKCNALFMDTITGVLTINNSTDHQAATFHMESLQIMEVIGTDMSTMGAEQYSTIISDAVETLLDRYNILVAMALSKESFRRATNHVAQCFAIRSLDLPYKHEDGLCLTAKFRIPRSCGIVFGATVRIDNNTEHSATLTLDDQTEPCFTVGDVNLEEYTVDQYGKLISTMRVQMDRAYKAIHQAER